MDAVTYRAKLHGSEKSSVSQLISHIEAWVTDGSGVGILIQSLFVRVDATCTVVISSTIETECQPTPVQHESIGAIVGGIVAVLLIVGIILVITIVVIAFLVLRSGKCALKVKKHSKK